MALDIEGASPDLDRAYERLRLQLGVERHERLGVVPVRDLERFAVAAGTPEPWHAAPPLYLSSVMGWGAGPGEDELRPDGSGAAETRGLPLDGVRLMGAGQDLELHEPVHAGMVVVVHTRLTGVRRKRGRSGAFLVLEVLRRFTGDDGRPLVTCRESFVAR
ncbi:FAS1-like dehydratase domain-containing protein [Jiangella gansuensis]|uniref:FAS1-like dehydratase domain-containing protein n=1 Tax=Jiangella gansuensis TaxID=281473 RepID=UPI0004BA7689|nr:MaoC family dehydratase N-terminal domain-containing protein [Jiangella gansuensis]